MFFNKNDCRYFENEDVKEESIEGIKDILKTLSNIIIIVVFVMKNLMVKKGILFYAKN